MSLHTPSASWSRKVFTEELSVCRDEYFRMKVQWKSVSEEQEMRNSLLRGYRNLIGQLGRVRGFLSALQQRVTLLCSVVFSQSGTSTGRTDTTPSSLGTTTRA